MSDRTGLLYADTSALVKLAVTEAETTAVRNELTRRYGLVFSSASSRAATLQTIPTAGSCRNGSFVRCSRMRTRGP